MKLLEEKREEGGGKIEGLWLGVDKRVQVQDAQREGCSLDFYRAVQKIYMYTALIQHGSDRCLSEGDSSPIDRIADLQTCRLAQPPRIILEDMGVGGWPSSVITISKCLQKPQYFSIQVQFLRSLPKLFWLLYQPTRSR
jgi:hypothetical protein